MEENREECLIIGGGFHARIGMEGGEGEGGWESRRKSKNHVVNKEGKSLLELAEEIGRYILNGTKTGDEEGEYIYIGTRGHSIIDYVSVNENCNDIVNSFKIGERVDSDHMPLVMEIKRREEEKEDAEEEEGKQEEKKRKKERKHVLSWNIKDI